MYCFLSGVSLVQQHFPLPARIQFHEIGVLLNQPFGGADIVLQAFLLRFADAALGIHFEFNADPVESDDFVVPQKVFDAELVILFKIQAALYFSVCKGHEAADNKL